VILPSIVVFYLTLFAGFTIPEAHVMTCIAKWESSYNTKAINQNTNGSFDVGLFQINTIWHNKAAECYGTQLNDPIVNTKCARTIYEIQGFSAWIAFGKHEKECRNFKVKGVK
jgi:hypothetical protein